MTTTLNLALISMASISFSACAREKHEKMKSTKDCGACCTQGGDCCDKCGHGKCASCCDKKDSVKK